MDFSDEPYVRKYTRKTLTSRLLGWEGRAVRDAMLDEFDPAGIFAIRGDPAACISAVTEIPVELCRLALQRLVETETWVVTDRCITWPTFEEAQNCRRSDRERKRQSRRDRAAQSVTHVTPPKAVVTNVTAGHTESPSPRAGADTRAHPSSLPPSAPFAPFAPSLPGSDISSSPPPAAVDPPDSLAVVREVFEEWQRVHVHPDAKLDAKRTARIRAALKLHKPEQLKQAIRGALKDDWLMGRDPKSPRKYDGLETILRDTAKIESLIDLETGKSKPARRVTSGSVQPDAGRTGAEFFKGIRVS